VTAIVLDFFSVYLIEFMAILMGTALVIRFMAYKASKYDQLYFSTFTRQVELHINKDKENNSEAVKDVDSYLANLLGEVAKKLPNRSLRRENDQQSEKLVKPSGKNERNGKIVSLRDYVQGKQALIMNIQAENSVFKAKHPPLFTELTSRIMKQDKNWTHLFGVIPINGLTRLIDILPGLFIVFGVFGTFIGISMALPEIAKIDFNNLEASGEILSTFVTNVTFSMKTSIIGIFFSLILTFLNTLFPIKNVRNGIFKKVESALELMWCTIQDETSVEKQMATVLPKIEATLSKLLHVLDKDEKSQKKKIS
jgi:hypothetical protein